MTIRLSTEQRRAQIVDAAIKIIGEKGLREFTAAQIAQEVGIKDGTIFRHFKNKDEIVKAVLDRLEGLLLETTPSRIADPLERLSSFFLNRLKLVTSQPGIQSVVFSDQLSHAGGEEGLKRVMALRKKGREYILSCLLEASEKKLLRQELDLTDILILFNGAVMGLLFVAKDNFFKESIEVRAQSLVTTFLSMIRR